MRSMEWGESGNRGLIGGRGGGTPPRHLFFPPRTPGLGFRNPPLYPAELRGPRASRGGALWARHRRPYTTALDVGQRQKAPVGLRLMVAASTVRSRAGVLRVLRCGGHALRPSNAQPPGTGGG